MKTQTKCPNCGGYNTLSNKSALIIGGISLLLTSPWAAFFSAFFVGPLAIIIFLLTAGLGIFCILGATIMVFQKLLPKKYQKNGFYCKTCKYRWFI